jgi:hypothetical protein
MGRSRSGRNLSLYRRDQAGKSYHPPTGVETDPRPQLSLEEINSVFESRRPKARSFELAKDARNRAIEQKQRIDELATGVQSG